ncbi:MAG: hypothetical protein K2X01_02665 [Cyanobacteria bacterium]|nr:hypothetical protein [Cyanobacteriota bacterium]
MGFTSLSIIDSSESQPFPPLRKMVSECFSLYTRHLFVLTLPSFLYLIILIEFLPEPTGNLQLPPVSQWPLYIGLFLLYAAFQAGWFQMMHGLCAQFVQGKLAEKPTTETVTQNPAEELKQLFLSPFAPLSHFFPGVGAFFVDTFVGVTLQTLILAVIVWFIQQAIDGNVGIPPILIQWFQTMEHTKEPLSPEVMTQQLIALPIGQKTQLNQFYSLIFSGFALYGITSLLLLFWPPLLISRQKGALFAMCDSIITVVKQLTRWIRLITLLLLSYFLVLALLSIPSFLSLFGSFFLLLLNGYWMLFIFLEIAYRDEQQAKSRIDVAA